jgi:hypothetical protein
MIPDYQKFMMPLWIENEKKLIQETDNGRLFEFFSNPITIHSMVPEGGHFENAIRLAAMMGHYQKETGLEISNFNRIMEFGGGYGALYFILKPIFKGQYRIIDIPIISAQQALFMSNRSWSIGLNEMDLICESADFFVSTFALSEASPAMFDYLFERKMFGAEHFYICGDLKSDGVFNGLEPYLERLGGSHKMIDHRTVVIWR